MNKLLIVWTTEEIEVAKKCILLYGSVALERGYWDQIHLMVWGPSARLIAHNQEIQAMVKNVLATGVEASVCVVCSEEYNVTESLRSLGINPMHTGELLTTALKEDWKTITF